MKSNPGLHVLLLGLALPVAAVETWTVQSSGTKANLTGVACPNANTCYAVGDSGVILKNSNGSAYWIKQASGTAVNLISLSFVDALNGYVLAGDGSVLKTTNGGISWVLQSGFTGVSYLFFADANNGHGLSGTSVRNTMDGGLTWTSSPSPWLSNNDAIRSTCFVDAKVGYIVTYFYQFYIVSDIYGYTAYLWQNNLYKTTDAGVTWSRVSALASGGGGGVSPGVDAPYSLHFLDANRGYAVGGDSILATSDGGATWTHQSNGTKNRLRSVGFQNAGFVYAVGDSGAVLETQNGGVDWKVVIAGFTKYNLNDIKVVDSTAYIVGNGGFIMKKTGQPVSVMNTRSMTRSARHPIGVPGYTFELPDHQVFNLLGQKPMRRALSLPHKVR